MGGFLRTFLTNSNFELKKQSSCSMQFKDEASNPIRYCFRPTPGVFCRIPFCNIAGQAQWKTHPVIKCMNTFLVQTQIVNTPNGTTNQDVNAPNGTANQDVNAPDGTTNQDVTDTEMVDILSKLKHQNLATLIEPCPEAWAIMYEYLPNGSLEDRLNCKDNTPPLSWQTRIRIAAELCSALIFLHSRRPQGIVHGDLMASIILLDSNFTSKITISHQLTNPAQYCRIEPQKGTFPYTDPVSLLTGELTTKSDVFSFGIILLRLLTGRPALEITKKVQGALSKGNLKDLLDPVAGDWPFVQAQQLAHLAVRCADVNRENRPDLASEVWRVLEPMRDSCRSSLLCSSSGKHCQVPSYFVCPIFQETMQDPVVAADGFTYEAEAIKGWLDGHETSPMTNLQLLHTSLIPNLTLRSAIQEWLQQHPHLREM